MGQGPGRALVTAPPGALLATRFYPRSQCEEVNRLKIKSNVKAGTEFGLVGI